MSDKVWLRGEYEFASLFSYRLPDFSSSYAPSAPMPGPSAVKLALVATIIETGGQVTDGERLFYIVRDAVVALEPPETVAMSRVLLRRLKRMKDGRIDKSYGTREYVHLGGPIAIYLQLDADKADEVVTAMRHLRRIGSSDSLMYCLTVREQAPDPVLVARSTLAFNTLSAPHDLVGRPTFRLKDIRQGTTFAQVNPFSGASARDFVEQRFYVFPLRIQKQGRNWVWYRREPFVS
jgi:CRISPR-associated Cas5-like protein